MKKYRAILKNTFIEEFGFRGNFIADVVGSLVFITVIYFLWQAIYANTSSTIKGLTFEDAFLSLALAICFTKTFTTNSDFAMYFEILPGDIIVKMTKPAEYQLMLLAERTGTALKKMIFITLPTLILITVIFGIHIDLGINVIFFTFSIMMGFIIAFCCDFIVGSLVFFTESVWGLSVLKDTCIQLFSGVLVPVKLLPSSIIAIGTVLPFKSIYNDPVQILINRNYSLENYLRISFFQFLWMIVLLFLSRFIFYQCAKRVTVNGG